jgi:thiol:disulfide interchange protein DsbA
MNPIRRKIAALLALAPFASAHAQARPEFTELKPHQPVDTQGKIEVIEFFWYGCIHCYNLEPVIESWLKTLPSDAHFRRVPAVFNERWALDAVIFYTFEAMGLTEKLHRPLFDAIHRDRLRTDNQQALSEWLARQGVDTKKFFETSKSFGVQSLVKRAARMSVDYRIDGTPAMAVQGRYTVSAGQGGSREGMLATVNHLIGLVRDGARAARAK